MLSHGWESVRLAQRLQICPAARTATRMAGLPCIRSRGCAANDGTRGGWKARWRTVRACPRLRGWLWRLRDATCPTECWGWLPGCITERLQRCTTADRGGDAGLGSTTTLDRRRLLLSLWRVTGTTTQAQFSKFVGPTVRCSRLWWLCTAADGPGTGWCCLLWRDLSGRRLRQPTWRRVCLLQHWPASSARLCLRCRRGWRRARPAACHCLRGLGTRSSASKRRKTILFHDKLGSRFLKFTIIKVAGEHLDTAIATSVKGLFLQRASVMPSSPSKSSNMAAKPGQARSRLVVLATVQFRPGRGWRWSSSSAPAHFTAMHGHFFPALCLSLLSNGARWAAEFTCTRKRVRCFPAWLSCHGVRGGAKGRGIRRKHLIAQRWQVRGRQLDS